MVRKRCPTQPPGHLLIYFSQKAVTVQACLPAGREGMAQFLQFGCNFYGHYACRGTKLISETDLSRCNKCYKMGTGAVSRYKLTRSLEFVTLKEELLQTLERSRVTPL
jgi:hypothetical protein